MTQKISVLTLENKTINVKHPLTENFNTLTVIDTSLNLSHLVFGPQPDPLSRHRTLHGLQQSKLQLSFPEEMTLQALPKIESQYAAKCKAINFETFLYHLTS